jgi:hypothetical protein
MAVDGPPPDTLTWLAAGDTAFEAAPAPGPVFWIRIRISGKNTEFATPVTQEERA